MLQQTQYTLAAISGALIICEKMGFMLTVHASFQRLVGTSKYQRLEILT